MGDAASLKGQYASIDLTELEDQVYQELEFCANHTTPPGESLIHSLKHLFRKGFSPFEDRLTTELVFAAFAGRFEVLTRILGEINSESLSVSHFRTAALCAVAAGTGLTCAESWRLMRFLVEYFGDKAVFPERFLMSYLEEILGEQLDGNGKYVPVGGAVEGWILRMAAFLQKQNGVNAHLVLPDGRNALHLSVVISPRLFSYLYTEVGVKWTKENEGRCPFRFALRSLTTGRDAVRHTLWLISLPTRWVGFLCWRRVEVCRHLVSVPVEWDEVVTQVAEYLMRFPNPVLRQLMDAVKQYRCDQSSEWSDSSDSRLPIPYILTRLGRLECMGMIGYLPYTPATRNNFPPLHNIARELLMKINWSTPSAGVNNRGYSLPLDVIDHILGFTNPWWFFPTPPPVLNLTNVDG